MQFFQTSLLHPYLNNSLHSFKIERNEKLRKKIQNENKRHDI